MGACLSLAFAASCSSGPTSSGPAGGSGLHGTLIVFGAGTLANPFGQEIAAFRRAHPGVTVHSQFGASGIMTKNITQLHQPADVLGVADYSLIPKLMFGGGKPYATWYLGFVSNQITFAYTSHSKGAAQLTTSNWYKVLAGPGVRIGRSDPSADPSGYQTLQMLQLAQGYYHAPGLSASVLKNSPGSSVATTETSLLGALQSGQIDYLAIYRSDALQNHLRYIQLPAQINLSDPALAAMYRKAAVTTALGTLTGKPIIYGLTIPSNAPDPALARRFVEFVLSPPGQAIMRGSGFVVISPALAANHSAVPAGLRSTTTAWAPPAG
jgi:molybdate/tungstate transport system substrate-binding protein